MKLYIVAHPEWGVQGHFVGEDDALLAAQRTAILNSSMVAEVPICFDGREAKPRREESTMGHPIWCDCDPKIRPFTNTIHHVSLSRDDGRLVDEWHLPKKFNGR